MNCISDKIMYFCQKCSILNKSDVGITIEELKRENDKLREELALLKQEQKIDVSQNKDFWGFEDLGIVQFSWDFTNRKITWSKNAIDLLNLDEAHLNISETEFLKLLPLKDAEIICGERQQDKPKNETCKLEFQIRDKQENLTWLRFLGKRNFSNNNECIGIQGIIFDINELKNKESELGSKHEFIEQMIDYFPNQIYWKNKDLVYEKANQKFADSIGISLDKLIGKTDKELNNNKEFITRCQESDKIVKKTEKPLLDLEEEYVDKNGERCWVLTHKIPQFKNGKFNGILGVSTNITKRKIAEEEIKLNKLRYLALFDKSPMGMWEKDLTDVKIYVEELKNRGVTDFRNYLTNNPNELLECSKRIKILDANKVALQFDGVKSKTELIDAYARKISKSTAKLFIEGICAIAEDKKGFTMQAEIENIAGIIKTVFTKLSIEYSPTGKVHAILAFIDVSEEVKNRKALFESEEKFKAIYDSSGGGIGIIDVNGIVLDVNNGGCEILGIKRQDIVGKPYINSVAEEDKENSRNVFLEVVGREKPMILERKYIKGNGRIVWGLLTATPVFNSEKQMQYLIVQLQDITAIKYVEAKLKKGQEELRVLSDKYKQQNTELQQTVERAERSEKIKSDFLQNLSHEIRTPVNAIMGFSNLIQLENLEQEQQNQYLEIIKNSSEHLLRLIEDIVEVSTLTTNKVEVSKKEFNINQLLAKLSDKYKDIADTKGLSFTVVQDALYSDFVIVSDENNLRKVLDKLIDNAIKYTPKGSVDIGCSVDGDDIYFFVRDTGVGISKAMQMSILNPFFQADRGSNKKIYGLGLGLTFASEMTKLLGGEIVIDSNISEGSKFTIKISDVVKAKIEREYCDENSVNILEDKILIIEKEDINFLYITTALKHIATEFDVFHAKNRNDVFALLSKHSFKLLLISIGKYEKQLCDLVQEIQHRNPGIRLVAQIEHDIDDEFKQKVCTEYECVRKPIELNKLRSIIDEVK